MTPHLEGLLKTFLEYSDVRPILADALEDEGYPVHAAYHRLIIARPYFIISFRAKSNGWTVSGRLGVHGCHVIRAVRRDLEYGFVTYLGGLDLTWNFFKKGTHSSNLHYPYVTVEHNPSQDMIKAVLAVLERERRKNE